MTPLDWGFIALDVLLLSAVGKIIINAYHRVKRHKGDSQ
jgi:hypothetical protein